MDSDTRVTERQVVAVGRCKSCEAPMRAEYTCHSVARTTWGLTGMKTSRRTTFARGEQTGLTAPMLFCACGKLAQLKLVNGTKTEHVCDARCMESTGPTCLCSCGGANHGSAHTVSA